ncbi:hypothetical protein NFI96_009337, partial [Prochilodus magdalenae]
ISSTWTNNSWDWIGHGLDKVLDLATSTFRHSYIKGLVRWSRFGGCRPSLAQFRGEFPVDWDLTVEVIGTQAGETSQQPIRVEFKEHSLSYMERLLLKKHRRTPIESYCPLPALSSTPQDLLAHSPTQPAEELTAEEIDLHEYYVSLFALSSPAGGEQPDETPKSCPSITEIDEAVGDSAFGPSGVKQGDDKRKCMEAYGHTGLPAVDTIPAYREFSSELCQGRHPPNLDQFFDPTYTHVTFSNFKPKTSRARVFFTSSTRRSQTQIRFFKTRISSLQVHFTLPKHQPKTSGPYTNFTLSNHQPKTSGCYTNFTLSNHQPNTSGPYTNFTLSNHQPKTSSPQVHFTLSNHQPKTSSPQVHFTLSNHQPKTSSPQVHFAFSNHQPKTSDPYTNFTLSNHQPNTSSPQVHFTLSNHQPNTSSPQVHFTLSNHQPKTSSPQVHFTLSNHQPKTSSPQVHFTLSNHQPKTSGPYTNFTFSNHQPKTSSPQVHFAFSNHQPTNSDPYTNFTLSNHQPNTSSPQVHFTLSNHQPNTSSPQVHFTLSNHQPKTSGPYTNFTFSKQQPKTSSP